MYNTSILKSIDYKVGIYIRLSKEDIDKKRESESESIVNQRSLLLNYTKDHNLTITDEYVDDGYSGTTFDRPNFNRLINDIEIGKINMVITKDLSRLGRDYIQSGYYLEQYFPMKKVRYVSVIDNVDTAIDSSNNDIAPFKSLFNDMQSKDTSKKIRVILRDKKKQGLFLGSSTSFGYMKDKNDKHKLIINPETAPIVRKIFDLALEGKTTSEIAVILNNEKTITPIAYKGIKVSNRYTEPNTWTNSSVNNILKNRMYTGSMIQGVQAKLSYKSKKRVILDEPNWIIVPNTHEKIISEEEFNLIAKNHGRRISTRKKRDKLLLEGLVYCEDCGCTMGARTDNRSDVPKWVLNCNKYTRNPKLHLCTSHFLLYKELEEIVLKKIKFYLKQLNTKTIENDINKATLKNDANKMYDEKNMLEKKIKVLNSKLKSLYNDKFNNIIGTSTYLMLSKDIEEELEKANARLETIVNNIKTEKKEVISASKIASNFLKSNPTRDLLFSLIDKIYIHKDKTVEIVYKFSNIY